MYSMTIRMSDEVRRELRRDSFNRDIPMNSIIEVLIRAHYGLDLTPEQDDILRRINP